MLSHPKVSSNVKQLNHKSCHAAKGYRLFELRYQLIHHIKCLSIKKIAAQQPNLPQQQLTLDLKERKSITTPLLVCLGNCVLQMISSLSAKFFQNDFLMMCPNPVNR